MRVKRDNINRHYSRFIKNLQSQESVGKEWHPLCSQSQLQTARASQIPDQIQHVELKQEGESKNY